MPTDHSKPWTYRRTALKVAAGGAVAALLPVTVTAKQRSTQQQEDRQGVEITTLETSESHTDEPGAGAYQATETVRDDEVYVVFEVSGLIDGTYLVTIINEADNSVQARRSNTFGGPVSEGEWAWPSFSVQGLLQRNWSAGTYRAVVVAVDATTANVVTAETSFEVV